MNKDALLAVIEKIGNKEQLTKDEFELIIPMIRLGIIYGMAEDNSVHMLETYEGEDYLSVLLEARKAIFVYNYTMRFGGM